VSMEALAQVSTRAKTKGPALLTLYALAGHHNKMTGQCNPYVRTLASETGLAKSTVCAHILQLEKAEDIKVFRLRGRGSYYDLEYMEPGSKSNYGIIGGYDTRAKRAKASEAN